MQGTVVRHSFFIRPERVKMTKCYRSRALLPTWCIAIFLSVQNITFAFTLL